MQQFEAKPGHKKQVKGSRGSGRGGTAAVAAAHPALAPPQLCGARTAMHEAACRSRCSSPGRLGERLSGEWHLGIARPPLRTARLQLITDHNVVSRLPWSLQAECASALEVCCVGVTGLQWPGSATVMPRALQLAAGKLQQCTWPPQTAGQQSFSDISGRTPPTRALPPCCSAPSRPAP